MVTSGVVVVDVGDDDDVLVVGRVVVLGLGAWLADATTPVPVGDVGELVGVVVRALEREAVVAEVREVVVGVPASGAAPASTWAFWGLVAWSALPVAALLGIMKRKTPTAVAPATQSSTKLGSGFQLPPLVTEWWWRPSSRT